MNTRTNPLRRRRGEAVAIVLLMLASLLLLSLIMIGIARPETGPQAILIAVLLLAVSPWTGLVAYLVMGEFDCVGRVVQKVRSFLRERRSGGGGLKTK